MIPPSLSSTYPHGPRLPSFKPTFYISFWFSFLLILCNILYKGLVNEPTCLFLLWPWLAFKFSSGPQTFQIKFPWGKQRFFPLQITLQGFSKSIGIPHFITLHRCSGVFFVFVFLPTEGRTLHQQKDYNWLYYGGLEPRLNISVHGFGSIETVRQIKHFLVCSKIILSCGRLGKGDSKRFFYLMVALNQIISKIPSSSNISEWYQYVVNPGDPGQIKTAKQQGK